MKMCQINLGLSSKVNYFSLRYIYNVHCGPLVVSIQKDLIISIPLINLYFNGAGYCLNYIGFFKTSFQTASLNNVLSFNAILYSALSL